METKDRKIILVTYSVLSSILLVVLLLFVLGIGHDQEFEFSPKWSPLWLSVEFIQIWLGSLISFFLLKRWVDRPNKILLTVTLMLQSYILAQLLIFLKKLFWFYMMQSPINETTYLGNMLFNYRFSLMFAALASWLFYQFYLNVFQNQRVKSKWIYVVHIATLIAFFGQLYSTSSHDFVTRTLISALVLIQSLLVSIPVAFSSYKLIRKARKEGTHENSEMRELFYGMFFLFLIAICYLGILISYVASILWDAFTNSYTGPFYVLQQIFVYLLIINCYLGFVFPKWFKKYVLKLRTS